MADLKTSISSAITLSSSGATSSSHGGGVHFAWHVGGCLGGGLPAVGGEFIAIPYYILRIGIVRTPFIVNFPPEFIGLPYWRLLTKHHYRWEQLALYSAVFSVS